MAPRKKPATILKRDHAFTEAIGKPASRKPNAYSMAAEDFKERLEMARTGETSRRPEAPNERAGEPGPTAVIAHTEASDSGEHQGAVEKDTAPPPTLDRLDPQGGEDQAADDSGDKGATDRDAETPPKVNEAEAQPKSGEKGTPDMVEVLVSISVPQDLVERAGRWAAIAHQPATTVLRHALRKMKPRLLDDLKTVRVGDVHRDRIEKVGYRLQSRLRLTAAEFADLEARLDPGGFGILSSMLNHYSRDSFTDFLDNLLIDAGY